MDGFMWFLKKHPNGKRIEAINFELLKKIGFIKKLTRNLSGIFCSTLT